MGLKRYHISRPEGTCSIGTVIYADALVGKYLAGRSTS